MGRRPIHQLVDKGAGDAGSRQGLKPKCSFGCCSARLKSCPVTKRRREGGLSAVCWATFLRSLRDLVGGGAVFGAKPSAARVVDRAGREAGGSRGGRVADRAGRKWRDLLGTLMTVHGGRLGRRLGRR